MTGCAKPSNVKSDSTDSKKEVKKEEGKEKEQKRDLLMTPDLKMHELAGNVKEVRVYSENKLKEVLEFDRNGELVLKKNDKELKDFILEEKAKSFLNGASLSEVESAGCNDADVEAYE